MHLCKSPIFFTFFIWYYHWYVLDRLIANKKWWFTWNLNWLPVTFMSIILWFHTMQIWNIFWRSLSGRCNWAEREKLTIFFFLSHTWDSVETLFSWPLHPITTRANYQNGMIFSLSWSLYCLGLGSNKDDYILNIHTGMDIQSVLFNST